MNQFNLINPDLHMHSTFSDGTDTPEELVENVRKAGIDVFALTDHDSYKGCDEIRKYLKPDDPAFISGVELSCRDEGGKYHILGYGYNVSKPALFKAIDKTHNMRRQKAVARLKFLSDNYNMKFSEEDNNYILSMENPGKPHFADLMLKYGYVEEKPQAFTILSEYHGSEVYLKPEEAIDAILASNGIPVLAHGILGDGSKNFSKEKITDIVSRFKSFGLMGLECYYSTFTPEQKQIMLDLASEYNLLITAGSDYHGSRKPVGLGETNNPDADKMNRFYQAVVIVANE